MHIAVTIEPADTLSAKRPDKEILSQILSALYSRMGDNGWRSVRVDQVPEYMDENEYDMFINQCCELIPESYEQDAAAENIIIKYLKDMETFGGILAKMVAPYR